MYGWMVNGPEKAVLYKGHAWKISGGGIYLWGGDCFLGVVGS
jgi:hypothetical protein